MLQLVTLADVMTQLTGGMVSSPRRRKLQGMTSVVSIACTLPAQQTPTLLHMQQNTACTAKPYNASCTARSYSEAHRMVYCHPCDPHVTLVKLVQGAVPQRQA